MTLVTEVLIVGARAAGAALALLLARAGVRVTVIDRGQYGSDTLSTHSLMRPGVLQLHRWGVLPRLMATGLTPIRASRFCYGAQPTIVPVKASHGIDALYAPRRTALDRVLVDMATEAGAQFLFGTSLRDLRRERGLTHAVTTGAHAQGIAAPLVIGADGRHSRVAELVGAPVTRTGQHASAVVYSYWRGLDIHDYWWSYGTGASAGAIPTNHGETCVFASIPSSQFAELFGHDLRGGYRAVIAAVDGELDRRLDDGSCVEPLHGFAGSPSYARRSSGPGWALAGDAAHFKDPITAHGITDALRDAELLARAVLAGSPLAYEGYEQERERLATPVFEISDALASYAWTTATVEQRLRHLSEAMAEETRTILRWPDWPTGPAGSPSSGSAQTSLAEPPDRARAG